MAHLLQYDTIDYINIIINGDAVDFGKFNSSKRR